MGILILDYHASFGTSMMDVEVELENIIIHDLNMFLKKEKSFMNRRIQANRERVRKILWVASPPKTKGRNNKE